MGELIGAKQVLKNTLCEIKTVARACSSSSFTNSNSASWALDTFAELEPLPVLTTFRVQGLGFRVEGPGFRGPGFRVQSSGFRVEGLGFRVQGSGFRG